MTATPKTATTAEIAAELGTTPRELRKFLRANAQGVGKGARYALPANKTEMTKMRKNFANWAESAAAAKAAKADKKAITPEEDNLTDMEIIDEALEDTEPTDADIEALELELPNED